MSSSTSSQQLAERPDSPQSPATGDSSPSEAEEAISQNDGTSANNNSGSNNNNESRSTSATPTLCNQQRANNSQTPAAAQNQQQGQSNKENDASPTHRPSMATSYQNPRTISPKQPALKLANLTSSPLSMAKQEPYYHNLFQWEQLVSKGVTRPLLINDLDFTDLIDEDDCDLLNSSSNPNQIRRHQPNGEPLTINIPGAKQHLRSKCNSDHESGVDSDASTGSPNVDSGPSAPASAPPPMPPPPMSPWFNTVSTSRPQSQLISSPSPTFEQTPGEFNREQSPTNSTYSNYSRNSVCVPQSNNSSQLHFNTLQPVSGLRSASSMSSLLFGNNGKFANKRKKTMKLFWKEVREDRSLLSKLSKKKTIWDEIKPIQLDTSKLEYLFESKAKDLLLSKSRTGLDGSGQKKVKITVLDAKRSNAINIGMTKLPPMRTIKSAILKMDSSIMNREGIEKILTTMMPTEEEKSRIIEAQLANPDTPLGTAEQFLLNLASISALEARLKLWAFQLDYAQIEKEVAEPLMDLKQAIEEIEKSETFRIILGTLLAVGNFLNSTNAKGFQIDYLEKVPEVKDTVHKHSLLHHLCLFIQEKYDPQLTSDLYSEFSAVNRASKVDYTEIAKSLKKMQLDCKASWDHLKIVAKHDGLANLMNTCSSSISANSSSSSVSSGLNESSCSPGQQPKSTGKLNNLSKLSMITTIVGPENSPDQSQPAPANKQLKTKVSDFLTDCAERIMVLVVIHRRVMNRFQKLLVYLGCPSHQIKTTQPQQFLKIINEFALEYRTKRERVREMLVKKQQSQHHSHGRFQGHPRNRTWQLNRARWSGSQQCIDTLSSYCNRPCSTASPCTSSSFANSSLNQSCNDSIGNNRHKSVEPTSVSTGHESNNRYSTPRQLNHHANQSNQSYAERSMSPSSFSQVSNYSDYLFDQSRCDSRQESITPVPPPHDQLNATGGGPHSMPASMFNSQSQQRGSHPINASATNFYAQESVSDTRTSTYDISLAAANFDHEEARKKDEQLRRLLGAGKSLDGACKDLYKMSHWTSTMTRVTRHPFIGTSKIQHQRAASIDTSGKDDNTDHARQSSYYKNLNGNSRQLDRRIDDETEPNSDEEILQSLVRKNPTANRSRQQCLGEHQLYNGKTNTNNGKLSSATGIVVSNLKVDNSALMGHNHSVGIIGRVSSLAIDCESESELINFVTTTH